MTSRSRPLAVALLLGICRMASGMTLSVCTLNAPLADAVAVWHFDNNPGTWDLCGGESDFTVGGSNFTVGHVASEVVSNLLNSDGYAAREGAEPSFGYIDPLQAGQELRAAAGGPLTLFVRMRRAAFAGNDSLARVGSSTVTGNVTYSLELVNGNPVLGAWGTNETACTLQYLGSTLATNVWYDLTGVFDPGQPGVADGKVTLYVFDLAARRYVGIQETTGLPYEALRDDFDDTIDGEG